jgi:hypothetical protein
MPTGEMLPVAAGMQKQKRRAKPRAAAFDE